VHLGRVPGKAGCDNCIDYRTDPCRNAVEESERLSVFKSLKNKTTIWYVMAQRDEKFL